MELAPFKYDSSGIDFYIGKVLFETWISGPISITSSSVLSEEDGFYCTFTFRLTDELCRIHREVTEIQ